jgi:hypothetical protein
MLVEVYHCGTEFAPQAPFALVKCGQKLPPRIEGARPWLYWKLCDLKDIAVLPAVATEEIKKHGYFVQ